MALPNSRILIHQPSGGFEGQSSDIEIHAREVLALRARVDEIYAKHTGQSVERVHADMERDRYFTGEEALAYGLVDRVIERRRARQGGTRIRRPLTLKVVRRQAPGATELLTGGRPGRYARTVLDGL